MIYSIDFGDVGGVASYSKNLVLGFNSLETNQAERISLLNDPGGEIKKLVLAPFLSIHKTQVTSRELIQSMQPQKTDVLILHDASTMRFLCKEKINCFVWIVLHGDYEYYYNTALQYSMWTDRTIAVNRSLQRVCNELLRPYRVQVDFLAPSMSIYPSKWKKNNNEVIFVGRLENGKGAHLLPVIDRILCAEYEMQLTWRIVYQGEQRDDQSSFFRWRDEHKSRIHLHSDLDKEAIFKLYSSALFYVLPSRSEGHPMSLVEALGHGCIPFMFRYSEEAKYHVPEEFQRHITENEIDLARALGNFRKNKGEFERASGIARNFFEKHHGPEGLKETLQQFLSGQIWPKTKSPTRLVFQKWKRRIFKVLKKFNEG